MAAEEDLHSSEKNCENQSGLTENVALRRV